jgi:hypothetical protein
LINRLWHASQRLMGFFSARREYISYSARSCICKLFLYCWLRRGKEVLDHLLLVGLVNLVLFKFMRI